MVEPGWELKLIYIFFLSAALKDEGYLLLRPQERTHRQCLVVLSLRQTKLFQLVLNSWPLVGYPRNRTCSQVFTSHNLQMSLSLGFIDIYDVWTGSNQSSCGPTCHFHMVWKHASLEYKKYRVHVAIITNILLPLFILLRKISWKALICRLQSTCKWSA